MNSSYKLVQAEWLIIIDSSEGAHNSAGSTPVSVSPVFPRFQEVLPPSVVGIFIEDPVAIHHITGVHMPMVETVRHTGAVIHEFHHVTSIVSLLIDPHSVWSPVLLTSRCKGRIQYTGIKETIMYIHKSSTFSEPHHWYLATGSNTATEAHPSLVVRILASLHKILVAHIIWTFIDHETATLYSDGVAATEVSV